MKLEPTLAGALREPFWGQAYGNDDPRANSVRDGKAGGRGRQVGENDRCHGPPRAAERGLSAHCSLWLTAEN